LAVGDDDIARSMRAMWTDAVADVGVLNPGVVNGCDLRATIAPRVQFWWEHLIPEQWRAYVSVRRIWREAPPSAVAVPGLGDHVERGAFAALRSLGTPAFIYQHGGFVGACECPPWDCNDLWLTDHELTYGSGATSYFAERSGRYPEGRAQPISVGSSRLDAWRTTIRRGRAASSRPHVLIVPNVIVRNNRYFDAGTTPDVLESELQVAVVEAARDFPQYRFTFKAFQSPEQRLPAVEQTCAAAPNCRIETRTSLLRLMARADFIVLLFASTALLEALLTDRRILVLVDARFARMRSAAKAALERRASIAGSPKEFLDMYRHLLQLGQFDPIAELDDTFLKSYGTHLNDGGSAERALAAIRQRSRPASSGAIEERAQSQAR
jgi:hypothetical protein